MIHFYYQAKQLTQSERDELIAFAALYWDALQVDEFQWHKGMHHERIKKQHTE